MKITKDTKIGDLIPEGFNIISDEIYFDTKCETLDLSGIIFEKKEEKNFDWYIDEYFFTHYIFSENIIADYKVTLKENHPTPFEIKIGLLNFICNDIGINLDSQIKLKVENNQWPGILLRNCPEKFLESIFE